MNNFENEKSTKNGLEEKALEEKGNDQGDSTSEIKDNKMIVEKINEKFGKFASSEQLLNAYNNLEKEFTRKSQKLKELECTTSVCDNEGTSPQNAVQMQVENFAKQNPQAQKFADDIAKQIIDNPDIAQDSHSVELAYLNVLKSKYIEPSELVKDRNFVESFVLTSPELKQIVLQDYINTLSKSELPQTINGMNGAISLTPPFKPKSIREASKMAENYFNK